MKITTIKKKKIPIAISRRWFSVVWSSFWVSICHTDGGGLELFIQFFFLPLSLSLFFSLYGSLRLDESENVSPPPPSASAASAASSAVSRQPFRMKIGRCDRLITLLNVEMQ